MAARHEIEIEISSDGKIQVHVKGAKGEQCLAYVQLFAEIGRIDDRQLTSEYYEKPPDVRIAGETKTNITRPQDKG